MGEKIRITVEDLASTYVDEIIERERAIRAMAGSARPVSLYRRIVLSSMFYLAVAGLFGGLLGWALVEPIFDDFATVTGTVDKRLSGYTLQYCAACESLIPADSSASGTIRCPTCNGTLDASAGPRTIGVLEIGGVNICVLPQASRLIHNGEARAVGSLDEIPIDGPVRVKGTAIDGKSMIATRIETNVPPGGSQTVDLARSTRRTALAGLLWFGVIGGLVGLLIGAVEGLVCLNFRQAAVCGGLGLGVGLVGGVVGVFPGGMVYALAGALASGLMDDASFVTVEDLHGMPLFIQIVGRSLAWAMVGMALPLGQGIARKSRKIIINGLLGGCIGGALGGLLFDVIAKLTGSEGAEISRCIGFMTIGLLVGLLIGLVEQFAKESWLFICTGPLSGKHFVVYKPEITIGSSPACDVYVFKDDLVYEEHARLVRVGRAHQIDSLHESGQTYVNGVAVTRRILSDRDLVKVGVTEFEYRVRGL